MNLPGIEEEQRPVYRIAKWREVYETADSRKHKTLTWISIPLGFNSSGYQSLLDCFDAHMAAALYGCWIQLCRIAADSPERGVLAGSDGQPYSLKRLCRLSGMPRDLFVKLHNWAVMVGWLEVVSVAPASIDRQSFDDRLTIGLPNPTQPNPTRPHHHQTSVPGGGGESKDTQEVAAVSTSGTATTDQSEAPTHSVTDPTQHQSEPVAAVSACETVISLLRDAGLALAEDTATKALSIGHTVQTVEAVCAYFTERDWWNSAGPLRKRLVTAELRDLPPEQGWPPATPEKYARWKSRRQSVVQQKQSVSISAPADPKANAAREAELIQLELQFGEQCKQVLESATDHDLLTLLTETRQTVAVRLFRRTGERKSIRTAVLRALAYQNN